MLLDATDLTAGQVLKAFHHDAPYLFLGAAFVAVGLISAGFSTLRRKHDSLLIYFAVFAVIYGSRLWVQADLLQLTLHDSEFYLRLRSAIDFIVPIPAVFFSMPRVYSIESAESWVTFSRAQAFV